MAKITTYPQANTLTGGDKLIGTQVNDENNTKNFTLDQLSNFIIGQLGNLPHYSSDAYAISGGLAVGAAYYNTTIGALTVVLEP